MYIYGTEEYLGIVLLEYLNSLHCTLTDEELEKFNAGELDIIYRKDFIDFIVQKRRDLEAFATTIAQIDYENYDKYGIDLGRILEMNAGSLDSLTILNGGNEEEFEMTLMSDYITKENAEELGIDHFTGSLRNLSIESDDEEDAYDFYFFLAPTDGTKYSLEDYDTYINVNPDDYESIVETFAMAYANDKYAIGGFVSNLYDTNLSDKIGVFKQLRDYIKESIGVDTKEYIVNNGGSIVRLMKY